MPVLIIGSIETWPNHYQIWKYPHKKSLNVDSNLFYFSPTHMHPYTHFHSINLCYRGTWRCRQRWFIKRLPLFFSSSKPPPLEPGYLTSMLWQLCIQHTLLRRQSYPECCCRRSQTLKPSRLCLCDSFRLWHEHSCLVINEGIILASLSSSCYKVTPQPQV